MCLCLGISTWYTAPRWLRTSGAMPDFAEATFLTITSSTQLASKFCVKALFSKESFTAVDNFLMKDTVASDSRIVHKWLLKD